ncbi:nitrite reductase large subunit NirB [Immundisolibacter cernigliae]|nr:nitrite reductase large subunit NirB [Immundisolibacter cernigliae]
MDERPHLIVIGNGMAASRAVDELLARAPQRYCMTVLGAEPAPAYNRVLLSAVLAGEAAAEQLRLQPKNDPQAHGVRVLTGQRVAGIQPQTRRVLLADGESLTYDRLLLATGARATHPPLQGSRLPGVIAFRTLSHLQRLQDACAAGGEAVVVGGGLLGLETAAGLARQGMAVTVLHAAGHLLNRQLDPLAAAILQAQLEARGISFELNARAEALLGEHHVEAVRLADGRELPARLVVFAVGIGPRAELAREAGLACNRGVLVDDALATSDPHIDAVGECAEHRGISYGVVAPVHEQAAVWARRRAGDDSALYVGSVVSAQLKVSGIDVFSSGDFDAPDADDLVLRDPAAGVYRRLVLAGPRVVGAVLVGDVSDGPWFQQLIASRTDISAAREVLLFGRSLAEPRLAAGIPPSACEDKPMQKTRLLVIGNGMVGQHLVDTLAETAADRFELIVCGEETRPAYDRVHLSEYFGEKTAEELALTTPDFYARHGFRLRTATPVTTIDRAARSVTTAAGEQLSYDKLVIASGSFPFVPPVPGRERPGCFVYRTLDDLDAIRASAQGARVGVVVGGGLLGLEAANALKALGLEAHVVEFAPQLMGVQLDGGGGAVLRRKIEALGVRVHTGRNTREIVDGESCRHRMVFADGEHLETDLIVFSAGIRPRDELARACGLEVGERGGIVVDDQCRTCDPDIYAIGECALWSGRIYGLVAPGYQMAKTAAADLCGGDASFTGADMSTKLKLLGVDVGSIGDAHARTPGALCYTYQDDQAGVYKKLVVDGDGKRLLGAVLVGDAADYGGLLQYCLNGIELPAQPQALILPDSGGGKPAFGPDKLPTTAQICSCHDVSKGALVAAIDGGCTTVADLKTCTKAGTGCGGCAPLVKSLLELELKKRGLTVNTDLCEHFPYTRQDLYNLVRMGRIETFDALLEKHGRGRGCDICKPTVAAILAACWNDYVLKPAHEGLQDSNDRFLANLQKDGTYSVIPRVPGGEITPDKLIVLGEVAKEFDLYTKITGGQRIDLLGARVDQLPAIWRRLVDAGFESGHAYAKALRTVKSCVGSTWCRYGVDDSVGLAIELEERYKGLRSPHKLKFAVSGCTRECAEAQSKDVGVIATEHGWNLYICGNGGMKPRHADLFATALDKSTLIRYIDRFLMFYIRTADRLQRTSVWLDNLEGGIEYVREVVIDDRLGLGAELEAEMGHVIDTYECEWKKTVDDPERLRRFRAFVNSDTPDETIHFVRERGQPRPARADERATAAADHG